MKKQDKEEKKIEGTIRNYEKKIEKMSEENTWQYFLDVSTSNTGLTMIQGDRCIITSLPFSKIPRVSSQKDEKLVEKFRGIEKMLNALTKKYPPSHTIVMEGIFINRSFVNSSEILLKFHGFLIHYFLNHELRYIPPSNIKKALTGKGNAKKEIVQEKILERWPIEFMNTDQSDAFAVYITWEMMEEKPMKIERIEVKTYEECVGEKIGKILGGM